MPNYGHDQRGINLANYRLLAQANARKGEAAGYRSTFAWTQETKDHVGMGNAEAKIASSLRHSTSILQHATAEQTISDVSSVEEALQRKLNQTAQLKTALEATLTEVLNEIENCVVLKNQLEERLGKTQSKLDLNGSRLQAREQRPQRERTMDDVEKNLLKQQSFISMMADKVKRAVSHLDKELSHLESVRQRLEVDLKDKVEAIEVDAAVLRISTEAGSAQDPALLRKKHEVLARTPHSWVRATEETISMARHWMTDSARLRKAIRHAVYNARQVEHEVARSLNHQWLAKLSTTHHLKDDLEKQLARIRDEQVKVEAQRTSLAAALEAKRGPLQQARERFHARKAMPVREHIHDDVEAALTREIAHLNAVTSQLSDKVTMVDKELASLELAAAMITDNIRDKEAALQLDERAVLLDGRINLTTPPPSSVASYPSTHNGGGSVKTQTLRRIQELEQELASARRERQGLEHSIGQLKEVLGGSPGGPLSPMDALSPCSRR